MQQPVWDFDSLIGAKHSTLEQLIRECSGPALDDIVGYDYRGWNTDIITSFTGRSFVKRFYRTENAVAGCNLGAGPQWEVLGRPYGFFQARSMTEKRRAGYEPYQNAALLDYDIDDNSGLYSLARTLHDIVVLPDPGNSALILGKAYLWLPMGLNLYVSYFVLGRLGPSPS